MRNATRLFGVHIDYRFIAVQTSQRKKKTAVFHNEKKDRWVSQRENTAVFHNEKDRWGSQQKDRHFSQQKRPPRFTTERSYQKILTNK